jgi:epoxyqueuosine reductase
LHIISGCSGANPTVKPVIQRLALELGFDDCRVTSADPPASAARLEAWLASGCHGTMAYLQRNAEKRVNPQRVLPGARSIITLASSYADPSTLTRPGARATGIVARYARTTDYHDVLAERLKVLTERITALGEAGARSLWYVDTGPILERDLAQRAGLGFVGKHTNLISRRLGNWFFISEILTTIQLTPDASEPNRCGSCIRCIDACPTHAITGPFQLDARRCISYLTIELRGPIPAELRPAIGNRIFGCDDCLAACPWNRFAREGALLRRQARPDLEHPDLVELLALDGAGFKERFHGTPIYRLKRRGLLRNVCVALGNVGDASALVALERAARDPEPLISEHATWAISQIQTRTNTRPRECPRDAR